MTGLLIGDGRGGGGPMEVKNQRAQVDADIHSALEEHSEKGDAYSWTNVTYNMGVNDTIIGIRNTSATLNLHIDRCFISSDVATVATLHRVNGSAALAGTAISAVNLNGQSGKVADAEAKGDETTNSSQGDILLQVELVAAITKEIDLDGAMILGSNDMFGIDYVADAAIVHITVFGFFNTPR